MKKILGFIAVIAILVGSLGFTPVSAENLYKDVENALPALPAS